MSRPECLVSATRSLICFNVNSVKIATNHSWNLTEQDAIDLQVQLSRQVELTKLPTEIKRVMGVDVAYSKTSDKTCAGLVTFDVETMETVESTVFMADTTFAYIPGLFSFREIPAILGAIENITVIPDLIVCDGHGLAHPRGFGLASHLGVLLDIPTIGCAKTPLLPCEEMSQNERGATVDIVLNSNVVGKVVRTQVGIKPVYVSAGNKITLEESVDWVLRLAPDYRLPESTRRADQLVNKTLKNQSIPE